MSRITLYFPFPLLGTLLLFACAQPKNPNTPDMPDKSSALWRIVNDSCVKNQQMDNTPSPCDYVNLKEGYAILKDIKGKTQFLLIPTKRISGIESPDILAKGATNYWLAAWEARTYVFGRAGHELPNRNIGMAINSPYGRSQDQLHIHIDCLKPEVIDAIAARKDTLTIERWKEINFGDGLHSYQAKYMNERSLRHINPFKLLAEDHKEDMPRETLVVAGTDRGFVLLADTADLARGDRASGEELLDHSCKVAEKAE